MFSNVSFGWLTKHIPDVDSSRGSVRFLLAFLAYLILLWATRGSWSTHIVSENVAVILLTLTILAGGFIGCLALSTLVVNSSVALGQGIAAYFKKRKAHNAALKQEAQEKEFATEREARAKKLTEYRYRQLKTQFKHGYLDVLEHVVQEEGITVQDVLLITGGNAVEQIVRELCHMGILKVIHVLGNQRVLFVAPEYLEHVQADFADKDEQATNQSP